MYSIFFMNFIILRFYVGKTKDLKGSVKAVADFHEVGDLGR